jgi:gamma-glutamyltranspeptidase / glutathione hydrolase
MTLEDLKNYKAIGRRPVSISFRDFDVYSTAAPSSGVICLAVLKTLEQYPVADLSDVNLTTHRVNEAMRFAYGARTEIGDPEYVSNVAVYEDRLLSTARAKDIRKHILDNMTQPVEAYNPGSQSFYTSPGHGTSHIVTADASGMAVSSTTTINLLFGAQIITPDSGIIINDEMNDFSIPNVHNEFGFPPAPANFIRPGKRPLSSITPVIAEFRRNGSLFLVTGAAGGSRIISSTMLTAWNVLEMGSTIKEAIAQPRLHDQLIPNQVRIEWTFDNTTAASMLDKGHNVTWIPLAESSVQGLTRAWDGTFDASGETRQKNSGGLTI